VHRLENPAFRLTPVSRTFHGRDVFAPAAAHLAAGVDPAELGPGLDPGGLVRLERPSVRAGVGRVAGGVVAVDHFGNLALDMRRRDLEKAGVAVGDPVEVLAGGRGHRVTVGETFASVPAGELVLHEDSFGSLAVAVNRGRAADRLGVGAGDPVEVAKVPADRDGPGGSRRGGPPVILEGGG
jgi:S-adenosylmethionine hydrolase